MQLGPRGPHEGREIGEIYQYDGSFWKKISSEVTIGGPTRESLERQGVITEEKRSVYVKENLADIKNVSELIGRSYKDIAAAAESILAEITTESQIISAFRRVAALYDISLGNPVHVEGARKFAGIERYAARQEGEDAINFFRRAWKEAPRPFFREDVAAHDPDLIEAISMRCRNLNRRKDQPKIYPHDILPPPRPAGPRTQARRKGDRERKARQRREPNAP